MGCSGWREHNQGAERAWQVTGLRVWGAGRSGRGRGRRCGLGPGPGGLDCRAEVTGIILWGGELPETSLRWGWGIEPTLGRQTGDHIPVSSLVNGFHSPGPFACPQTQQGELSRHFQWNAEFGENPIFTKQMTLVGKESSTEGRTHPHKSF